MTDFSMAAPAANPYLRAGAAALLVLLITSVHHAYGAIIYETPWRLHIVYIAVPVAAAFMAALYVGASREGRPGGRLATWIGIAIILAFPVVGIGFFEGGYNHVVKNIAYFTSGESAMRALFPQPIYDPGAVETPNDFIFELTGIVQFPLAVVTAVLAFRLARRAGK